MSRISQVRVSAPGRICLFGEHQDFLGRPVIACAIDLAMEIVANAIRLINVHPLNIRRFLAGRAVRHRSS